MKLPNNYTVEQFIERYSRWIYAIQIDHFLFATEISLFRIVIGSIDSTVNNVLQKWVQMAKTELTGKNNATKGAKGMSKNH